jgi:hypothetical protein
MWGKNSLQNNRGYRVEYAEEHKNKTVDEFCSKVFFTDEFHVDPSAMGVGHILREQGHRYDPKNIQERESLIGV